MQAISQKAKESKVVGKVLITHEEILAKAKEIGEQITKDFAGEPLLLVGILRGSVPWMADLMKCIDLEDFAIDFIACSSYGAQTKTSGTVKIMKDIEEDVMGKNVIIVEDIIDSGITLNYLNGYLKNGGAKSIRICALLDKPTGRQVDVKGDYVGFTVGDVFIVGYGLDYNQKYRQLPYISCLD